MLYRTVVNEQRTKTFWIVAHDHDTALADAEVIAGHIEEWDTIETDVDCYAKRDNTKLDNDDEVYTGGPEGLWVTARDLGGEPG